MTKAKNRPPSETTLRIAGIVRMLMNSPESRKTFKDMAALLEMSVATFADRMNGSRPWLDEDLVKIIRHFDIDPRILFMDQAAIFSLDPEKKTYVLFSSSLNSQDVKNMIYPQTSQIPMTELLAAA